MHTCLKQMFKKIQEMCFESFHHAIMPLSYSMLNSKIKTYIYDQQILLIMTCRFYTLEMAHFSY